MGDHLIKGTVCRNSILALSPCYFKTSHGQTEKANLTFTKYIFFCSLHYAKITLLRGTYSIAKETTFGDTNVHGRMNVQNSVGVSIKRP